MAGAVAFTLAGCGSSGNAPGSSGTPSGSSGGGGAMQSGSTGATGSISGSSGVSAGTAGTAGDTSGTPASGASGDTTGAAGATGAGAAGAGSSGSVDMSDASVGAAPDTGTTTGSASGSGGSSGGTGMVPVYDSGPCVGAICNATSFAQIGAAHTVPAWLKTAKLGIGMHFMVAAVPADHNEWFYQHMYCNSSFASWTSTYFPKTSPLGGPWGYKDFIPGFTCSQWAKPAAAGAATNAQSWAALFKKSGASFVNATAMHHDRFAMWDSAEPASIGGAGKWNAAKMGPMRDVVGELGTEVKKLGMKYGVNNHMMYGYSFAYCGPSGTTPGNVGPNTPTSVADLYDPRFADLYGPPNPGCGVQAAQARCTSVAKSFCDDWLWRANELVDKYQLDDQWFDFDGAADCEPQKLAFALHYYQTAASRGQEVQIMGKTGVFQDLNGANVNLPDYQASIPNPAPSFPWMIDLPVASSSSVWCYVDANGGAPGSAPMQYRSPQSAVSELQTVNAKGGILMINISPMADGTIPQGQIDILNALGKALGAQ